MLLLQALGICASEQMKTLRQAAPEPEQQASQPKEKRTDVNNDRTKTILTVCDSSLYFLPHVSMVSRVVHITPACRLRCHWEDLGLWGTYIVDVT